MKRFLLIFAMLASGLVIGGTEASAVYRAATSGPCGTKATAQSIKHVVVIVEENANYSSVLSSNYFSGLATQCGLATSYNGVSHPSLPNYIAMTSGQTNLGQYGGDCAPAQCSPNPGNNIFNQVGAWKSYDESMPYACDKQNAGTYAPKHNPALYYSDLSGTCGSRDVPLGSLLTDLGKDATAPRLAFVTPNLCNDGHDCGVGASATWLARMLPQITATATYKTGDTAIFVVWDEGSGSNHIALFVIGASVKPGTRVTTSYSHYNLLAGWEGLLKVPNLSGARPISGFNL